MDPKTLSTVCKLVNQATSDNPAEADAAAKGAIGRLKKAGATFEEFLGALDPSEVFQNGLVRVADRYASSREDLSVPARRELFAMLIAGINYRYSGSGAEGNASGKAEPEPEPEAPASGSPRDRQPSPSPAKRPSVPPWLRIWKEDPRLAARVYSLSALFGCFAAVAGPLALAFAFAALGGVPSWAAFLTGEPTFVVMAGFGLLGFAVRTAAFFEPEWGEKLFPPPA